MEILISPHSPSRKEKGKNVKLCRDYAINLNNLNVS